VSTDFTRSVNSPSVVRMLCIPTSSQHYRPAPESVVYLRWVLCTGSTNWKNQQQGKQLWTGRQNCEENTIPDENSWNRYL